MLDMYAVQKAYIEQEITDIGLVGSSYNLIDGLTKPHIKTALYQLLTKAYHNPKVEQCIIRDPQ